MLLPALLREYAGLGRKAVLIGQANKFELWDAEVWNTAREAWLQQVQEDQEANEVLNQVSM